MEEDTLIARFEEQARRRRDAVGLSDGVRQLTYGELDSWASTIAKRLQGAGVQADDFVGVSVRRNSSVIAGILGILKAGAAYVPLDPDYPTARIAYIVNDAQINIVLTDRTSPGGRSVGAREVLLPPNPIAGPKVTSVGGRDSTVYVMYTSGSTGEPKGIPVSNGNVLALFDSISDLFEFRESDCWSFFHSPNFDVSVWEIWGAFLHGARLACVSDLERVHGRSLARMLTREHVTVVNMVPSVFQHLISGTRDESIGGSARYLIFAGEALDPKWVKSWMNTLPTGAEPSIVNMYGATETTIHATFRKVTKHDLERQGLGTLVGTALPHLRLLLIDGDSRPIGGGEHGEICVAGDGIVKGYLNRDAMTSERFVMLPDADGKIDRFFRSGDLGMWSNEESSFVFLGRLDDQMKVRGFRVEPGEIEHAARRIPGIVDAVAGAERDGILGDRVSLVVTGDGRSTLTPQAIREALRSELPPYLVPDVVYLVESLRRLPSGKIDRQAYRQGWRDANCQESSR